MTILVTGGAGRLARALAAAGGERVRAPARAELDITDAAAVEAGLDRLQPAVVINCAAVSSPDRAAGAFAVNAEAPGALAAACAARGTALIQVSSDYVFGAPTDRPWREDDPVSPVNDYGRQKAEAERRVLASGARACIVRVAWLFGDGEGFPERLSRTSGEVRVAEDQVGSPTPIGPLAERLLQLADRFGAREVPPILHLAGSPPVSRADWTAAVFAAAGRPTPRLVRTTMASFEDGVPRPAYSALDTSLAEALLGARLDWRAQLQTPR